jgi:hypothetical protein
MQATPFTHESKFSALKHYVKPYIKPKRTVKPPEILGGVKQ